MTVVCNHFIEAIESGKYGWFWVRRSQARNRKILVSDAAWGRRRRSVRTAESIANTGTPYHRASC